jgi:hypothetical protein
MVSGENGVHGKNVPRRVERVTESGQGSATALLPHMVENPALVPQLRKLYVTSDPVQVSHKKKFEF